MCVVDAFMCTFVYVYFHRLEQLLGFDSLSYAAHYKQSPDHTELFQHMLISRCAGLGGPVLTYAAQWLALILGCPTTHQKWVLVGLTASINPVV